MKEKETGITPKYEWIEEDGSEFIAPVKRRINKTMEITESFTYYDCLAYCMKMEKALEDKKGEILGLEAMIKAYREEIELIEKELDVTKVEENYQLDVLEKIKAETPVESPYERDDKTDTTVAA